MTEILIVLGLIGGVVAAHELGFWPGSLGRSTDEAFDRQVALVRASTAALVAFLIGFAFSGAASRFIDRLDIIVKEANALGTAHLRADTHCRSGTQRVARYSAVGPGRRCGNRRSRPRRTMRQRRLSPA